MPFKRLLTETDRDTLAPWPIPNFQKWIAGFVSVPQGGTLNLPSTYDLILPTPGLWMVNVDYTIKVNSNFTGWAGYDPRPTGFIAPDPSNVGTRISVTLFIRSTTNNEAKPFQVNRQGWTSNVEIGDLQIAALKIAN